MKTTISFLTQDETTRLLAAIPTKHNRALSSSPPTATATGSGPKLILAGLFPASRALVHFL